MFDQVSARAGSISAEHGLGIGELFDDVAVCWKCGRAVGAGTADESTTPKWLIIAVVVVIVAFVLGYPMRKSLPYLFVGVIIGNLVALGLTTGAVRLF